MTDTIRALYSSEAMQKAFAWIKEDESHTLEQQLELVQIPACFNCEEERALHFRRLMEAEGYKTHMDEVGNVYTRIRGTGNGPTVYISAHLDTVFPMDTPLTVKREGNVISVPGIADDTRGLAEILCLLRTIRETDLRPVGDIIIGGNVGEEGLGDLRGMKHFFRENPDTVDAFVSIDAACPVICYGGTGSYRYRITFRGPGGHSFGAFGLVNPIHAMGRAIAYISELRTQEEPRATFNVGVVEGGTSVNSIASSCSMMVDMRSDDKDALATLEKQFLDCLNQAVEDENNRWTKERGWKQSGNIIRFDTEARINMEIEKVGDRPVGHQPEDFNIVPVVAEAFEACGIEPDYMPAGSTDSNIPLSLGIPAVTVAGGGLGGNGHSVDEYYDCTDACRGVQKNLLVLFRLAGLDGVCEPGVPKRTGKA